MSFYTTIQGVLDIAMYLHFSLKFKQENTSYLVEV